MKRIIAFVVRVCIRLSHKGEHVGHAVYMGMVAVMADHAYRYAAGLVLVMIIINAIAGEE